MSEVSQSEQIAQLERAIVALEARLIAVEARSQAVYLQPVTTQPSLATPVAQCRYCSLPVTQCPGHTICGPTS